MGYNLLINGVYWGYNPLTNHLLSSWHIQERVFVGLLEVTWLMTTWCDKRAKLGPAFSRFLDIDIEDDCRESGMPGASKKTFFCWTFLEPLHVSGPDFLWKNPFPHLMFKKSFCTPFATHLFFYLELTYIIEVHKFAPFVSFCWKLTCFIQILPNTFPRIFSNILGSRKNFHAFTGGGMRRAWLMAWSSKIFRVLSGVCVVRGEAKPLLKSKVKLYNIDPFCRRKNHHSWTGIM